MAIRLRKVEGSLIAVCAAKTSPKPGDVYLDDNAHYALTAKFARGWQADLGYDEPWPEWRLMSQEGDTD